MGVKEVTGYWVCESVVWIDIVFLHQPPGVFNV